MSAALKECPHCGSPATLEDHRTVWAVKCTSTACATIMLGERAPEPDGEMGDAYWNGIKQTAIDRWNARAIAPPVAAGSVDTRPSFSDHMRWVMEGIRKGHGADSVAISNMHAWHISWCEQMKEAGKQEALNLTFSVGQLRERAEKAEAEVEFLKQCGMKEVEQANKVHARNVELESRVKELQEALDVAMMVVSLHAQ